MKNISREGPGLLETVLEENEIGMDSVDLSIGEEWPDSGGYSAVFVFGGPASANDESPRMKEELRKVKAFCEVGIPYLGVCLGMQILVKASGGWVHSSTFKEIGWRDPDGNQFEVDLTTEGERDPLFREVRSPLKVFQLHGETVRLGTDMALLGKGKYCENQVVRMGKNAYGVQGHIEMTPTMLDEWIDRDPDLQAVDAHALREDYRRVRREYEQQGNKILTNFLRVAEFV